MAQITFIPGETYEIANDGSTVQAVYLRASISLGNIHLWFKDTSSGLEMMFSDGDLSDFMFSEVTR